MLKALRYSVIYFSFLLSLISCNHNKETAKVVQKIAHQEIIVTPAQVSHSLNIILKDSLHSFFKNKDSLIAFYQLRNNNVAWSSIKNRNELYQAIKDADKEGLTPTDYQLKEIESVIKSDPFSKKDNVAIDILFTNTYLSFAYHLANGKTNPKKLHNDWALTPNTFNFNSILNTAVDQKKVLVSLNQFKPTYHIYAKLKKILPSIKALINADSLRTIVVVGNKIKPNKIDKRIPNIRKRLNELGFLQDSLVNNSEVLDTLLQNSIKEFQTSKKLKTDAIIGDETVNALNRTYEDQYQSIIANLERWRWFPRNLGVEYLLINIPDYNLEHVVYKDTFMHKVIVGRADRKTPVFTSAISYLEFNPKWYIPPTIKKEDIIPAVAKDISYLKRKNITVYNRDGQIINPDSIQWKSKTPSSFRYVQGAGNSNALGRVKFIFPNKFSVYLHDTPSKYLFEKNYRSRSSGCVRVQKPFELAERLLKKQNNWSRVEIDTILARKTTRRIHINRKIYVHFLYYSVVFNEQSEPVFLNDLYDLDKKVFKALAN